MTEYSLIYILHFGELLFTKNVVTHIDENHKSILMVKKWIKKH